MTTQGFELIYLETHNWGKSVAFWKQLGFALEFETDHHSGILAAPNGSRIYLAEKSLNDPVGLDLYLGATEADGAVPGPPVDVVQQFTPTHWGAQVMTVRDPDGRLFRLQAPVEQGDGS